MSNAIVSAAATGLPSTIFNRRRMLLGLAAASTAAAAPAVAASTSDENASLLRMADEIGPAVAELEAARADREQIVQVWGPRWPEVPPEIYCPNGTAAHDLTGRPMMVDVEFRWGTSHRELRVWTAKDAREYFDRWDKSARRARAAKTRLRAIAERDAYATILAPAEAWEAECAAVRADSGYDAAAARVKAAEERLTKLIDGALQAEPVTMAGVLAQAQALDAAAHLNIADAVLRQHHSGVNWGQKLAASIMRIAQGNA
jgi:hypothetical protein